MCLTSNSKGKKNLIIYILKNFYLPTRSWEEYKNGFGEMDAEFWLGNDNLHYITEQGISNVLYYSYCLKEQ